MSERYSRLFALTENLYATGSPVVIAAGALLKDNQTGKVLAQLKIRNIGVKPIKAAKVEVLPLDTVGKQLDDEVKYQYLDLNVAQGKDFGSKSPIALPDASTRGYTAAVTEVVFTDNTLWQGTDEPWEPLPAPVTLDGALKDRELVKQYRMKFGADSKYEPNVQKDLWYCTCGELNRKEETVCQRCKKSASSLLSVDLNTLKQERDARVAAEQQKASEEKAAADAKAKKTKKLAIIITPIVIIAVIAALLIGNVVKKNREEAARIQEEAARIQEENLRLETYNNAVALMDAERYDDAIAAFTGLGDYKDSAELLDKAKLESANAPVYSEALALLAEGKYEDAYSLFVSLENYRDVTDYLSRFCLLKTKLHYDSYSFSFSGANNWNYEYFINYTYDDNGNLIREEKIVPERPDAVAPNMWEYEYDENGIKTRATVTNYTDSDSRQVTSSTTYEYAPNGVTIGWTSVKYDNGTEIRNASDYENTFSDSGCILYQKNTTVTENATTIIETFYDEIGNQLRYLQTVVKGSETKVNDYRYTYDESGNLLTSTRSYDGKNYEYTYGKEGQILTAICTDEKGNTEDVEYDYTNTYDYDNDGNLVKWVKRFDAGRVETTEYAYDAYGHLIKEAYWMDDFLIHEITYTYELIYMPEA